jgi:hypothetical protein
MKFFNVGNLFLVALIVLLGLGPVKGWWDVWVTNHPTGFAPLFCLGAITVFAWFCALVFCWVLYERLTYKAADHGL